MTSLTEVLTGTFVMSFWMFVYKQPVTSYYSVKPPLFLPDCGKALPKWAMPWSAPETFHSTVIQEGYSGSLAGLPPLPCHLLDIWSMLKVFMALSQTMCITSCPKIGSPPFLLLHPSPFSPATSFPPLMDPCPNGSLTNLHGWTINNINSTKKNFFNITILFAGFIILHFTDGGTGKGSSSDSGKYHF